MLLLRVQLPDRPGALGQLATALGTVEADIQAMEIVERLDGSVVDDFIVNLPADVLPEDLIAACSLVADTRVLWISRRQGGLGVSSAIQLIQDMRDDHDDAEQTLVDGIPPVFRAQWALLIDTENKQVTHRSEMAPELDGKQVEQLAPYITRQAEMSADWLPGWGDHILALTPRSPGQLLVCARRGGPEFLNSELAKLSHLTLLSL